MATLRRRRMPPEVPAMRSAASVSRTSSIRRVASRGMSFFCTPLMAAKSWRCSRADKAAQSVSNCGHTPMTRRTALMPAGCATVRPIIKALPREGGMNPVSMLTVVVFPAPFGPSNASKFFLTLYQGALTAKKGLPLRRNSAIKPRTSMALSISAGSFIRACILASSSSTSGSVLGSTTSRQSLTYDFPSPQYAGVTKYHNGLRTPIASVSTLSRYRAMTEIRSAINIPHELPRENESQLLSGVQLEMLAMRMPASFSDSVKRPMTFRSWTSIAGGIMERIGAAALSEVVF
eukprot:29223_3